MTSTTEKGSKSNRGNCVWRDDVNDATRQAKPRLAALISTTSNLAQRRLMSTMVFVCHNLPSVNQPSMFAWPWKAPTGGWRILPVLGTCPTFEISVAGRQQRRLERRHIFDTNQ